MIDLVEAARGAIFEALDAAHANSGARVVDAIVQDEEPPFVAIDDIDWSNEGSKSDPLLKMTVTIVTLYRGLARGELLKLMQINFNALNDVSLIAPGAVLSGCALVSGAVSGMPDDGVTRSGIQNFEIFAEPA